MTWDDTPQTYANLGWVGGGRGREARVIADIARDRKNQARDTRRGREGEIAKM
jgi:hypothetical protein